MQICVTCSSSYWNNVCHDVSVSVPLCFAEAVQYCCWVGSLDLYFLDTFICPDHEPRASVQVKLVGNASSALNLAGHNRQKEGSTAPKPTCKTSF